MTAQWAVVELGGKQHLVVAGSRVIVNAVDVKVGDSLKLESMLDKTPVTLKVTEHRRGEKINGLKFKNKVRYLKRYGHRQQQTVLEVASVGLKAEPDKDKAPKKTTNKKPAVKKSGKKDA